MGFNERVPEQTRSAILQHVHAGMSNRAAARAYGVDESFVRKLLQKEQPVSIQQHLKLLSSRPAASYSIFNPVVQTKSKLTRVIAIGDLHDEPGLSKERFKWIGKHIVNYDPDHVVFIGDICDLESLSFHSGNDTLGGKYKPRFTADMDSLSLALELLNEPIHKSSAKPSFDLTWGNHEGRIIRFEDANPEVDGMLQKEFADRLAPFNIAHHPYGEYLDVGGVKFTHAPMSVMAKPIGGVSASSTVARQSSVDIIFGHTHKMSVVTAPRLGGSEKVTVIDLGSALPDSYVMPYAKHSLVGWSYGIFELLIQGGRIQGFGMIPMTELERRYAD